MKQVVKQFIRYRILFCASVLVFLIPLGFLIFFSNLGMSGFSMLHTMARFNFYLCFFISILSFYFLTLANRFSVKEVIDSMGGKASYEKSAGILFLYYILLWNLFAIVVLCVSSIRNDGTGYFLSWFFPNYFINILVPQLICLLLSFVMAAGKNYYQNMIMELLFLFLISPLAEGFHWLEKTTGFPLDKVYQLIRWPFTILYQNGVWSPDYQTDFQMEPVRIFVSLFWLLLLFAGVAYLTFRKKVPSLALGIAALVLLACSYQPASLYRLNDDWNGTFADHEIYTPYGEINVRKEETEPEYAITSYDLNLHFGSELSVDGILEVNAKKEQKEFAFTLYRGFKLKQLEVMDSGTDILYTQNEDVITVTCKNPVKKLKLHIKYKGHNNKFYSNSCAAMLPGWFPWYPMSGTKQVFLGYEEYGKMSGYNPYNRISKADIQLKSNRTILTNLDQSMGKSFKGNSDSITVLGGNISETENKNSVIRNILPLQLMKETSAADKEKELEKEYEAMLSMLENEYGVDISNLQKRDIYMASKDLGRNETNNNLAIFDNYILAVPDYITSDEMIKYLLLSDTDNSKKRQESAVIQFFLRYTFFDIGSVGILEDIDRAFAHIEEYPGENNEYQKYLDIKDDIQKKAAEMESDAFGKDVVSYLLNPNLYADDQEFLESR